MLLVWYPGPFFTAMGGQRPRPDPPRRRRGAGPPGHADRLQPGQGPAPAAHGPRDHRHAAGGGAGLRRVRHRRGPPRLHGVHGRPLRPRGGQRPQGRGARAGDRPRVPGRSVGKAADDRGEEPHGPEGADAHHPVGARRRGPADLPAVLRAVRDARAAGAEARRSRCRCCAGAIRRRATRIDGALARTGPSRRGHRGSCRSRRASRDYCVLLDAKNGAVVGFLELFPW